MSSPDPRTTVPLEALRRACLVRAFEEADPEGRVLAAVECRRAVPAVDEGPAAFVARRAGELSGLLDTRARGLLAASRVGLPAASIAALGLLAGLATNALSARLVSVLAFPLLGALAWNLAVYAGLALHGLRGRGARPAHVGLVERLARAFVASRARRALLGDSGETSAVAGVAAVNFARHWGRLARPWILARLRLSLHLGAAALAAGMVGGMYLRGLAFEYRATWESTFLDAQSVQALLDVVLAPASALSRTPVPDVAPLRERAGDAAPWIHLWAWTALCFAILPRLALAGLEASRARRLARGLPLDLEDAYHRRLLAPTGGMGVRVEVAPYALDLGARATERLRALLHDLFGARATIGVRTRAEYGSERDALAPAGEGTVLVLVFGLAQTPELEVHARLLEELRAGLEPGQQMLVVVDAADYAARLGDGEGARARLDERRRAWDRAAREAGLAALHLDLSRELEGDVLARAGEALCAGRDR
ncbi:MAG TPA: DUF2868 domain-containing protein [Planctomycetota bacterium]|nr:DUF2868 domain-containing protein [Planctomycetota bacterium]